jgi:hypothetical protein
MNSINEINIKISFGLSGMDHQVSGNLRSEGESPPPPEVRNSAFEPSYTGANPPPPLPPGYASAEKQTSTYPMEYTGGEGPPPPPTGFFDNQSKGSKNTDPPEFSNKSGKESADPDSPHMHPEKGGSRPIKKKNKSS